MTTASASIATRAPDYDEIARVVQIYGDNFGAGDPDGFKDAFHEDAWIFYTKRTERWSTA
jgi:hypothetical protein